MIQNIRRQQDEDVFNLMPVKKFTVPVDLAAVKAAGLVHEGDSVLSELKIDIPIGHICLKMISRFMQLLQPIIGNARSVLLPPRN